MPLLDKLVGDTPWGLADVAVIQPVWVARGQRVMQESYRIALEQNAVTSPHPPLRVVGGLHRVVERVEVRLMAIWKIMTMSRMPTIA